MVDRRLPVFLKNMLINLIVRLFMLTFSGKFYDKYRNVKYINTSYTI